MNDSNGQKDHRVSSVYREGAWPEPRRQIDQAILAASRRAVRERHPFFMRWAPPVAIAATVLLTSSLVLKVVMEQPEAVSPSGAEKMPEQRAKQAPAAEEKTPEAKAPRAEVPAQQPVTTPPGFSSTMDAGEAARLDRMKRDLGTAKLTTPPSESPLPEAKPAPALKKETARPAAPATSTPQAAAPLSLFGASAPAPVQAPQPARAAAVGKPAQPFTQNPPARAESPQSQGVAADAMQPVERSPSPQAPAMATGAAVAGNSAGVTALAVGTKAPERSPQAWIEEIRAMLKEGKFEESGAEIAKFKKRYPDYVLPEDLR